MSDKPSFTPGPWSLGVAGIANVVAYDGYDIKPVAHVGRTANANLIAAAPDLYAALELCLSGLNETRGGFFTGTVAIAEAALAKARGGK